MAGEAPLREERLDLAGEIDILRGWRDGGRGQQTGGRGENHERPKAVAATGPVDLEKLATHTTYGTPIETGRPRPF
jgi:hypothetical protein